MIKILLEYLFAMRRIKWLGMSIVVLFALSFFYPIFSGFLFASFFSFFHVVILFFLLLRTQETILKSIIFLHIFEFIMILIGGLMLSTFWYVFGWKISVATIFLLVFSGLPQFLYSFFLARPLDEGLFFGTHYMKILNWQSKSQSFIYSNNHELWYYILITLGIILYLLCFYFKVL